MTVRLAANSLLVAVALSLGAGSRQPLDRASQAPGSATLAGTVVTDDSDGRPVRRAVITLSGGTISGRRQTISDENGHFILSGLFAGQYALSVSKAGWVTTYYGSKQPGQDLAGGATFTLKADEQRTDLVLRLLHGSAVTGTITDTSGRPAPNVVVQLLERQRGSNRLVPWGGFATLGMMMTDDRGVFRIYGVPPGSYAVVAVPKTEHLSARLVTPADRAKAQGTSREEVETASNRPAEGGPSLVSFAPVYYPGTVEAASATLLSLRANEEREGIDFPLMLVTQARIEGTIIVPAGASLSDRSVQLLADQSTPDLDVSYQPQGRATPDGSFVFTGVHPGHYWLVARGSDETPPAGWPNVGRSHLTWTYWAKEPITVLGGATEHPTLTLQRASTVSGHVRFQGVGSQPPTDLKTIRLSLLPESPEFSISMGNPETRVDDTGAFTFTNVPPGQYRVAVADSVVRGNGGARWVVGSADVAGIDAVDLPFEVTADLPPRNLVVTFVDHEASISGTIVNVDGRPVPDIQVLAMTADRSLWTHSGRRMPQPVQSDGLGHFRISGLPGGNYLLTAGVDVLEPDLHDPALLDSLAATAVRVTINAGEDAVQNLRVRSKDEHH